MRTEDAAYRDLIVLVSARRVGLSLALKRCLDVALGLVLLVAALPALVLACLAIRLDSRGPMLYRQWRCGQGGEPFQILKLRTMVDGADRLGPDPARRSADHQDRVSAAALEH